MTGRAAASRRMRPMGERALLVEVASLSDVLALHAALAASAPLGVVDLVPAARTVLVVVDPTQLPLASARSWIERLAADADAATEHAAADPVTLGVRYDGLDLDETAELLGMTTAELIQRHSAARWTVAFAGFAPGFAYLVSPDWPVEVPRLESPRTRVPAGSVGVAGEFTGAYPRATPGGWRLIGTTDAPLLDLSALDPALLRPGTPVRFVPERVPSRGAGDPPGDRRPRDDDARPDGPRPGDPSPDERRAGLTVIEPGLLATVQDLGRPGRASTGFARSGALDRTALRLANRLVGNTEGAATVEVAMGGFRATADANAWVAVTGASGALTIAGAPVDRHIAHEWPAGAELAIGWAEHGVRSYLAVRGGVDAAAVAGSRSTDTLAGIGPAPLRSGDRLAIGDGSESPVPVADIAPWGDPHDDVIDVELAPGPRADRFPPAAHEALFEGEWRVSNQADRVGIRLDGVPIDRADSTELPSEGMVPGAIQVPPSGMPTILLADGPVTGGYPVIAVVADASLDALGQARPGTRVRFRHAPAH